MQTVNTVEAKNRLNELIAEVVESGEPIVVEKRGKPVAVVVDFESFHKKEKRKLKTKRKSDVFLHELQAFNKQMSKKYPQGTGDSVEILREIKQERILK